MDFFIFDPYACVFPRVRAYARARGAGMTDYELIEKHISYIRMCVKTRVNNPDDAEDIIQDVCLRLLNMSGRVKTSIKALIVSCANSCIVDFTRKNKKRQSGIELYPFSDVEVSDTEKDRWHPCNHHGNMDEDSIVNAVWIEDNCAHEFYVEPVMLNGEGYSTNSGAEKMGVSVAAYKSRLYRGERNMKKKYERFLNECETLGIE